MPTSARPGFFPHSRQGTRALPYKVLRYRDWANRVVHPYNPFVGPAVAHRRANRFPATVVAANRGTSSKSARFFRHWRRFADFPDAPFYRTSCNPAARTCTAPMKNHVIAKPVRTLAVAIRTPVPLAPLPKGGRGDGEAVTGGLRSPRTSCYVPVGADAHIGPLTVSLVLPAPKK